MTTNKFQKRTGNISKWNLFTILFSMMFIVVASGCISETKKASERDPYFSVPEFMDREVEKYNEGNWVIYKMGKVNDNIERDTTIPKDSAGWRAELDLIYQANINKPAYFGLYEVTNDSSKGRIKTTYKAKKDKLGVQRFEVVKSGDQVRMISATINIDNVVYQSRKEFTYYPDSLYQVNASQSVMTGDKEQFLMEMRFAKNPEK